jgi:hypothetical protein
VPIDLNKGYGATNPAYTVEVTEQGMFAFKVIRKVTGTVL